MPSVAWFSVQSHARYHTAFLNFPHGRSDGTLFFSGPDQKSGQWLLYGQSLLSVVCCPKKFKKKSLREFSQRFFLLWALSLELWASLLIPRCSRLTAFYFATTTRCTELWPALSTMLKKYTPFSLALMSTTLFCVLTTLTN